MRKTVNVMLSLFILLSMVSYSGAVEAILKGSDGYLTKRQINTYDKGIAKLNKKAIRAEAIKKAQLEAEEEQSNSVTASRIEKDPELVGLKVSSVEIESGRFPSIISYGENNTGLGGFIFEEDSAAVWFRPLTECLVTGVQMYFHSETESVGSDVTLQIRDVKDGPIVDPLGIGQTIDGNGEYDFTIYNEGIAPFMGDVLYEYTFPLTSSDLYPTMLDIDFPVQTDVGARDFAIALFLPGADGADLIYYAGVNGSGTPYNHGVKWYHTGGAYCSPNPCWTPRLNFVIDAKVDYYGDPPPFVTDIEDLADVYASCDPGPYTPTANIVDVGTADFAGELTSVLFIYDAGAGRDTTELLGTGVSDIFTGSIPSQPAGTYVEYWWAAADNGDQNPEGGVIHWTDGQFSPLSFTVSEQTTDAGILVLDDSGVNRGGTAVTRLNDFLDGVGYLNDAWNTSDGGLLTSCELDKFNTVLLVQGWNGSGYLGNGSDLETALMDFVDAGGNLLFSSTDYIGDITGHWGDDGWQSTDAGSFPFLANYLHVSDYWSDANPDTTEEELYGGGSMDSLYVGIIGDIITGDLDTFTVHVPIATYTNWGDEVIADAGGVDIFSVYSDEEGDFADFGGISAEGTGKVVFIPWHIEGIDDDAVFDQLMGNLMSWFGEVTAPLVDREEGLRDGVAAGTYDITFTYYADDFDGNVVSAELVLDIDGVETTQALTDNGDGTYSTTVNVTVTDTSDGFVYATATDDDGWVGESAIDDFWGVDFSGGGADILYMWDHVAPYDGYGPADADTVLMNNLDAVGFDNGWDKWDIWDYGQADFQTVLSNYGAVIYAGIFDWNKWDEEAVDHTLAEYVADGGYLLYSSEEVLGTYGDWGADYDVFWPGHFVHDVLGVEWVGNDYNYNFVATYNDGGTGLLDNMDTNAIELDTNLVWLTGSMADLCDPVGYGTPDMLPAPFLGLYAPPNGYYSGSINGTVLFMAFNISMMPDNQQQILLTNFADWAGVGPAVDEDVATLPVSYALHQNFPNPFNPVTNIKFDLPEAANVKLSIYNIIGQKVNTLVSKDMQAGYHNIRWHGKDAFGSDVSSGVYIYRIEAGNFSTSKKMLFLK